jgi:hypothetical protein
MYGTDPRRQQRIRILFAGALAALGTGALVALVVTGQSFPQPVWQWFVFAAAAVYFEWRSVEVNDRLFASPSLMVVTTAAVVYGPDSAILGVVAMVALGLLTPADLKERRWFQPMVNFGQLTISATIAISLFVLLLPPEPYVGADLWRLALASGLAAVVYGFVNYSIVLVIVRSVFGERHLRPWSNLPALVLPLLGMGFLGGLLGATFKLVGPHTLPLIFAVFFVGHMTFASYAQLREAQESTLRGFVKALEAKDLYTRGHTERVAYFAELIGREMGFSGTRLSRLRWAALIHDVGKLAVPRDLIRKRARLTDDEYSQMQAHTHLVEDLLAEVDFLQPMVVIAANHHQHFDGNGYGPGEKVLRDGQLLDARILAVADTFDAITSTRSYRVALTQEYAFEELRRCAGSQFDPEVVEALIDVLNRRGERYGSPDVDSEEEARRRAEQAMSRDG